MNKRVVVMLVLAFASGCGSDDDTASFECFPIPGLERTKGNEYYSIGSAPTSDNIASDAQTGLTWARCSIGQAGDVDDEDESCGGFTGAANYTWAEALAEVQTANQETYEGFTDWRLPNAKELSSLVDTACANILSNTDVFPVAGRRYWSSSPSADGGVNAWIVDFQTGQLKAVLKSRSHSVRLVRGGD